ncbi:cytochrome c [Roseomonas sp. E05]|uniref:c-type cytochrome n=1 Tax=Roseomonas sp. E05 TaxID=3046310 RepID=UPI0024B8F207|nr:cytochrome c [Roseomonas sp. E05]MDJ0390955.1 cytochrome c [Roseomonas sp. E05]
MALSFKTVSYGLVGLTALVLLLDGKPRVAPQAEIPTRTASEAGPASGAGAAGRGGGAIASSQASFGPRFRNLSVELPSSDRTFPDGPGADLVNSNCLACHSASMVLSQPPLSLAAWTEEVNKMRNAFHAPVEASDVQAIAGYLASVVGSH